MLDHVNLLLRQLKDEKIRAYIKSHSAELSDTLAGFKVGYDYKLIPSGLYDKHWGFSYMGGYDSCYDGTSKGCKEGWSGVIELFEKNNLTCSYREHNTKVAHGGNELVEEFITYSINNKPTIEIVKKSSNLQTQGYTYQVEWFQKDYDRTLECASTEYSKELLNQVIAMAKEIDNR